MTSIMTEIELTILEDMDFTPACEYADHEFIAPGFPAKWIYISLSPPECGCVFNDRFFCNPCKIAREYTPSLYCPHCHRESMPNDPSIYRFEPIGQP